MPARVPAGLGSRGRKLWKALTAHGPSVPEQEVALEACRTADLVERLRTLESEVDLVIFDDKGQPKAHPVLAELRAQETLLKQLIAAVRVPDAETGDRPQKRGTPRGAYRVRGSAPEARSSAKPRSLQVVDDVG